MMDIKKQRRQTVSVSDWLLPNGWTRFIGAAQCFRFRQVEDMSDSFNFLAVYPDR